MASAQPTLTVVSNMCARSVGVTTRGPAESGRQVRARDHHQHEQRLFIIECNVIVNKLVKGSFVIIIIGKGSLLSDTVGGAWVSSTCTVFAYTEHLRVGADAR